MLASSLPIPQLETSAHEVLKPPIDDGSTLEVLKPPIDEDVITVQPKVPKTSTPPPPEPIPSPLSALTSIERLHLTKRLQVRGVLCLRGKRNRFLVRGPDQSLLYTIEEENRWWVGYFFYGLRPLQLIISNGAGREVMRIVRPYACTMRVLPCGLQQCTVYSPPDILLGSVEQRWTPLKPLYAVRNKDREIIFWIFGPVITISCYSDIQFSITRPDGTHVGGTCKRWQGLAHALFFAPVTDRFGVAFDVDLTPEEKGLLLAATLLLDYMYFDS